MYAPWNADWVRRHWLNHLVLFDDDELVFFDETKPYGLERRWFVRLRRKDWHKLGRDQDYYVPVFATSVLTASPGSNQTFTSPIDWNNSSNFVETIGGGGSGGACRNSGAVAMYGTGGGGGAWNRIINFSFATPGTTTATYQCGIGGAAVSDSVLASPVNGNAGGDTWFNGSTLAGSSCGSKAGLAGAASATLNAAVNGGLGGVGSSGVGTSNNSGGRGGNISGTPGGAATATGGGGAAGGSGAGLNGGDLTTQGNSAGGAGNNNVTPGANWRPPNANNGSGSGGQGSSLGGLGNNGGSWGAGGGGTGFNSASGTATSGAGAQGAIFLSWYSPTKRLLEINQALTRAAFW